MCVCVCGWVGVCVCVCADGSQQSTRRRGLRRGVRMKSSSVSRVSCSERVTFARRIVTCLHAMSLGIFSYAFVSTWSDTGRSMRCNGDSRKTEIRCVHRHRHIHIHDRIHIHIHIIHTHTLRRMRLCRHASCAWAGW